MHYVSKATQSVNNTSINSSVVATPSKDSSISSINSITIKNPITIKKLGQPSGATNENMNNTAKAIISTTNKASILWKECWDNKGSKSGSLIKIICFFLHTFQ